MQSFRAGLGQSVRAPSARNLLTGISDLDLSSRIRCSSYPGYNESVARAGPNEHRGVKYAPTGVYARATKIAGYAPRYDLICRARIFQVIESKGIINIFGKMRDFAVAGLLDVQNFTLST